MTLSLFDFLADKVPFYHTLERDYGSDRCLRPFWSLLLGKMYRENPALFETAAIQDLTIQETTTVLDPAHLRIFHVRFHLGESVRRLRVEVANGKATYQSIV